MKLYALIIYLYVIFPLLVITGRLVLEANSTLLSSKRNPLNVYIAKQAMGIATFYLIGFHLINFRRIRANYKILSARILNALVYWYALTQPIHKRTTFRDFVYTSSGGYCNVDKGISNAHNCRRLKGDMIEGILISGHCIVLIHSSTLLLNEMIHYTPRNTKNPNICFPLLYSILIAFYFLLIITCVYHHSFLELFVGIIFGNASWIINYHFVYPRLNMMD